MGGVTVPGKGVIIVKDECLNSEKGILGMNVISHFWKELFQRVHPELTEFVATLSQEAKGEWERAFSICQKVPLTDSSNEQVGVVWLTRQDPVYVPPNSETVLWTQLFETKTTSDFVLWWRGQKETMNGKWPEPSSRW